MGEVTTDVVGCLSISWDTRVSPGALDPSIIPARTAADVFTLFSALPTLWSTAVATSALPASREASMSCSFIRLRSASILFCALRSRTMAVYSFRDPN